MECHAHVTVLAVCYGALLNGMLVGMLDDACSVMLVHRSVQCVNIIGGIVQFGSVTLAAQSVLYIRRECCGHCHSAMHHNEMQTL